MRGKPFVLKATILSGRITPAHAGKTSLRFSQNPDSRDHPRACGENSQIVRVPGCSVGSPPRMRGKPIFSNFCCQNARITPAHAGKTSKVKMDNLWGEDHPRACGENNGKLSRKSRGKGSPPRMRGKPVYPSSDKSIMRITPAHAGKTRSSHSSTFRSQDHPRACGENKS